MKAIVVEPPTRGVTVKDININISTLANDEVLIKTIAIPYGVLYR